MDTMNPNLNPTPATNEGEKKPLKIRMTTPVEFKSSGLVQITTTTELSKIVNDIFSKTFADFYGSNMNVQFQDLPNYRVWTVVPELYFHVLKNDAYRNRSENTRFAFEPVNINSDDNMIRRIQRVSQMSLSSGTRINITQDGKDVLEDFMITPNDRYNFKKYEWEKSFTVMPTDSETYIRVFRLDALKLVKRIYGEKDPSNDSELFYQINPINGHPVGYNMPDEWNLSIMCINNNNLYRSAELTGIMLPNTNTAGPKMIIAR